MPMSKVFGVAAILLGIAFLVMAAANSRRYSAIGVDLDQLKDERIVHTYWRVRWICDGTVRCGGGEKRYKLEEETLVPFDPAGRLLEDPHFDLFRDAPWGFGMWQEPEAYDCKEGRHYWARWISVPAWLPAIVMLGLGRILAGGQNERLLSE